MIRPWKLPDFLGSQIPTYLKTSIYVWLEEELATVRVWVYDLNTEKWYWDFSCCSKYWRWDNVSDYPFRHLTVNRAERKTLKKEKERETLFACELCTKYVLELIAQYSADLNQYCYIKVKQALPIYCR